MTDILLAIVTIMLGGMWREISLLKGTMALFGERVAAAEARIESLLKPSN